MFPILVYNEDVPGRTENFFEARVDTEGTNGTAATWVSPAPTRLEVHWLPQGSSAQSMYPDQQWYQGTLIRETPGTEA